MLSGKIRKFKFSTLQKDSGFSIGVDDDSEGI